MKHQVIWKQENSGDLSVHNVQDESKPSFL